MIILPANLIDTTILPYVLFFIAGITGVLSLISLFALIYGISRRRGKKHTTIWLIILLFMVIICLLTITGNLVQVV